MCINKELLALSKLPLTKEIIRQLVTYNEDTGEIYWKGLIHKSYDITKEAGFITTYDRRVITINSKPYYASQLAYLYMEGYIPNEIDHKDTNSMNDAWENLRDCSKSQNQHNKNIQINNTSGVKGISYHRRVRKWQAQIKLHGKYYSAGYHRTLEEAKVAIEVLRVKLHGEFANHG